MKIINLQTDVGKILITDTKVGDVFQVPETWRERILMRIWNHDDNYIRLIRLDGPESGQTYSTSYSKYT